MFRRRICKHVKNFDNAHRTCKRREQWTKSSAHRFDLQWRGFSALQDMQLRNCSRQPSVKFCRVPLQKTRAPPFIRTRSKMPRKRARCFCNVKRRTPPRAKNSGVIADFSLNVAYELCSRRFGSACALRIRAEWGFGKMHKKKKRVTVVLWKRTGALVVCPYRDAFQSAVLGRTSNDMGTWDGTSRRHRIYGPGGICFSRQHWR